MDTANSTLPTQPTPPPIEQPATPVAANTSSLPEQQQSTPAIAKRRNKSVLLPIATAAIVTLGMMLISVATYLSNTESKSATQASEVRQPAQVQQSEAVKPLSTQDIQDGSVFIDQQSQALDQLGSPPVIDDSTFGL